jgi:hypothetical protein
MAGKGLSVKELLNGTPIGRRLDAALVHITKFAKGVSAKSGFPGVSAKTGAGRVVYDTQIIGTAHGIPLMKQQAVRVSCSCPDYMFNFEYANAHHQAGIVRYGNGDPPLNTNPSLTPGLCVAVGTLITTRDFGCIPIEEIKPGTVVLTYMGYFPVLDARLTGRDVQCVTVTSETDRSVNLTPTHPMMSHYASETSGAQAGGDVKFALTLKKLKSLSYMLSWLPKISLTNSSVVLPLGEQLSQPLVQLCVLAQKVFVLKFLVV